MSRTNIRFTSPSPACQRCRVALAEPSRLLHESVAYLGTVDSGRRIKEHARPWLATVFGMAGRAADARREFVSIQRSGHHPDAHVLDFDDVVAEA
jgi:hypothetical protein